MRTIVHPGNQIHKNHNAWIQDLAKGIGAQTAIL
jgi:hypothetical protein